MTKKIPLLIVCLFIVLAVLAQGSEKKNNYGNKWVDSVYNAMTEKQRIAQLLMIRAHSNKNKSYHEGVAKLIKDYQVGGLCFFQGGPGRQVNLTNYYQSLAKVPMLIAMDAEWGPGMRLDSTYSFPRQMTLGAIQDDTLIYEMGEEIAHQLNRLGVHINFAPVVDINVNPKNPVINTRSFGENKKAVAKHALAYMNALQDNNIIAVAKHFPGHGDTDTDSHLALPVVDHSFQRIDSIELYPFRKLISSDLHGVMSAHLYIPSLDSTPNTAGTISEKVIDGLLRNKLGFKGLIFTDALEMKGVTKYNPSGKLELKAFKAGNDILLLPKDVKQAIETIFKALQSGEISQADLETRVKRVLHYKYLLGLDDYEAVEAKHIYNDLNSERNEVITRSLAEHAITLVQNKNHLLPLKRIDTLKIASLALGADAMTDFQKQLTFYAGAKYFQASALSPKKRKELLKKLEKFNLVIVSIHNTNSLPQKKFGLNAADLKLLNLLIEQNKVVLNVFANPYSLAHIEKAKKADAIVVAYQEGSIFETVAAQAIFGGVAYSGKLPVSAGKAFPSGKGIETEVCRLAYVTPENLDINKEPLAKIDSIIRDAMKKKAFPGCQILAAKDGKVFLNKSYGYHTYDKKIKVKNTDIYDIASITKIAATTPIIMQLYDKGFLHIDKRLSDYFPALAMTNKKNLIIRDILSHQAKLKSWIPYYLNTLDGEDYVDGIYSKTISETHPVRVAEGLYIRKDYDFIIRDEIYNSELRDSKAYKYSDLGFILMYFALESMLNVPYDQYVDKCFYQPLGMQSTSYLPLKKFSKSMIIPTEKDMVFRKQLLHGDVHDQASALLGGVCGHAGLFSNANDLAKMMQMYLSEGKYGGDTLFSADVVNEFTLRQFPVNENRRGLGFDKAWVEDYKRSPVCESAGMASFGHLGFTGTLAWADPDNGLIFIFLSNRIHPSMDNRKLIELNIRPKIHELLYQAVENHNLTGERESLIAVK